MKTINAEMKKRTLKRDTDGRVIINMSVKSDENFLSEFTSGDAPVISSDVADFIENATDEVLLGEPLTLSVSSRCIEKDEREIYKGAVKEYYVQKYIANERELKRNRIVVIALSILGILVLMANIIFDYTVGGRIWTEVIDIVAWVLIWEAVDIGFFGCRQMRIKKCRYLSYISMNIEFED